MRLWHSTDRAGRDGIEAEGFRVAPDGPAIGSPDHGMIWFGRTPEIARQRASRHGWWVIVEAPADVPEYDMGHEYAGNGLYALPVDRANGLPRSFEIDG